MTNYNYRLTTAEMKGKVPLFDGIYYYDNDTNKSFYDDFYKASQRHLSEIFARYTNMPAYFYFNNSQKINAFALGSNLIGINRGLVDTAGVFFLSKNVFIETKELADYKFLNDKLREMNFPSLKLLMFRTFIQWLYFHELGHLAQNFRSSVKNNQLFSEENLSADSTYNLEKNMKEIDSDSVGINGIFPTLYMISNHFKETSRSEEILFKMFSVFMASIFSFFILLSAPRQELYFKKYTHPHPIIRLLLMISNMISLFESSFKTSILYKASDFLKESIKITNLLFEKVNSNGIENYYLAMTNDNFGQFKEYIDEISEDLKKFLYLSINTKEEEVVKLYRSV